MECSLIDDCCENAEADGRCAPHHACKVFMRNKKLSIFLAFFMGPVIANAQNFGEYNLGMSSNSASALGLVDCHQTRIDYLEEKDNITACYSKKYHPQVETLLLYFNNKTRKIVGISASINLNNIGVDATAVSTDYKNRINSIFNINECEIGSEIDHYKIRQSICIKEPKYIILRDRSFVTLTKQGRFKSAVNNYNIKMYENLNEYSRLKKNIDFVNKSRIKELKKVEIDKQKSQMIENGL